MIIGIDIDDTISETYAYLFPYAQKYTIEDLGKGIESIDRDCIAYWTEKEDREFFEKYYDQILINVQPKTFVTEIINKLKEEGNTIILITARFPVKNIDVEEITRKWLKDNNINYDKLILNAQDKVKFAKENHVEIFIDDNTKHCEEMSKTDIKTYIMDTILNLNYKNEKVTRLYSWPHLYQEISRLKGGE